MPVLPGMPVITLRRSPGLSFGLIHTTSRALGVTAVSTSNRSNGWSRSQWIHDVLVVPHDLPGVGVQG